MNRQVFCLAVFSLVLSSCAQRGPAPQSDSADVLVRYDAIHHPAVANAGMVVSQNALATRIGQQVLLEGGNAVDAAVAVGFALAVTLPRAGNIGGSGFMLVHLAERGEQIALDFRSAMPADFDLDAFRGADGRLDSERLKYGATAAAVPGTVAGLHEAWRRFGSKPWAELLAPAVALARDGIRVTHDLAFALATQAPVFRTMPGSAAIYLDGNSDAHAYGSTWRQTDLAWSLAQIQQHGAEAFYQGAVGERLVAAVRRDGGYISRDDLRYYQVRARTPLRRGYRGREVVTMPPVSGGGVTLLQMLGMLERFDVAANPHGSAASLHLLAEVMKQGAANRRFGIGDPDYSDLPVDEMLSDAVIAAMAARIDLEQARPVSDVAPMNPPPRNTTHYSVADQWGNAVSTTYTLGYSFGSGYVAEGTGILLDNQMRNFTHDDPAHANAPAPGKRMMSTMTPTIVLDAQGRAVLVTGTPGGSRIINVLLQMIVNVIDYGLSVAEATYTPRIHQPWRAPELAVEQGVSADTLSLLRAHGHVLVQQDTMGSTQSISLRDGRYFGAADSRRPGALAAGVQRVGDKLVPGDAVGYGAGSG